MTYRPKQKNFKAPFLSGICFLFATGAFYISSIIDTLLIIYQLIGIISASAAIMVFQKYVLCDYVYKASENELMVYKVMGKNSNCICSLNYSESLCKAVTFDEYLQNKSFFPKTDLCFNYCKTIFHKEYSLYFFNFNGKKAYLKFEPDKIFLDYLNEKIDTALTDKGEKND